MMAHPRLNNAKNKKLPDHSFVTLFICNELVLRKFNGGYIQTSIIKKRHIRKIGKH